MYKTSIKLNEIRTEKAVKLENQINKELSDLEMKMLKLKLILILTIKINLI